MVCLLLNFFNTIRDGVLSLDPAVIKQFNVILLPIYLLSKEKPLKRFKVSLRSSLRTRLILQINVMIFKMKLIQDSVLY